MASTHTELSDVINVMPPETLALATKRYVRAGVDAVPVLQVPHELEVIRGKKMASWTQANANAGGTQTAAATLVAVPAGRTVTVTAGGSFVPPISWGFGDGSYETSNDLVQAHTYASAGTFTITAQGSAGSWKQTTATVT